MSKEEVFVVVLLFLFAGLFGFLTLLLTQYRAKINSLFSMLVILVSIVAMYVSFSWWKRAVFDEVV